MIGNVASNDADCIAVAASRPGARNGGTTRPPSAAVEVPSSTYDPSPMPIAARNSSRRQERREDRDEVAGTSQPVLEDAR